MKRSEIETRINFIQQRLAVARKPADMAAPLRVFRDAASDTYLNNNQRETQFDS